jgi:hypothetical protein
MRGRAGILSAKLNPNRLLLSGELVHFSGALFPSSPTWSSGPIIRLPTDPSRGLRDAQVMTAWLAFLPV